jgi:hypothetical protein
MCRQEMSNHLTSLFLVGEQCEGSQSREENVEQESGEVVKKGTKTPLSEVGYWVENQAKEPSIGTPLMEGAKGHEPCAGECCPCCEVDGLCRNMSSPQGDIWTQLLNRAAKPENVRWKQSLSPPS